jgi:hypothetical protein
MDSVTREPHTHGRHHVLMAAVVTLLSACDAAQTTGVSVPTGNYTAKAINGAKLPYRVPNSTQSILIASASARLYANGRYELALDGSVDGVNGPVLRDNGSYSVSGSQIIFSSSAFGFEYPAFASTGTYSVAIPGILVHSTSVLKIRLDVERSTVPPFKRDVRAYGATSSNVRARPRAEA